MIDESLTHAIDDGSWQTGTAREEQAGIDLARGAGEVAVDPTDGLIAQFRSNIEHMREEAVNYRGSDSMDRAIMRQQIEREIERVEMRITALEAARQREWANRQTYGVARRREEDAMAMAELARRQPAVTNDERMRMERDRLTAEGVISNSPMNQSARDRMRESLRRALNDSENTIESLEEALPRYLSDSNDPNDI